MKYILLTISIRKLLVIINIRHFQIQMIDQAEYDYYISMLTAKLKFNKFML